MSLSPLAKPLSFPRPKQIEHPDDTMLGYGWDLGDDARRDIEEIEANARHAKQHAGSLTVR